MKIQRFEDIIAWQKSKELVILIYKNFQTCKDYSFRDQIQRASVSTMNNVAEGFERIGDKELRRFLIIAKGSAGEVRSMLYIALEIGHINKDEFENLLALTQEISRLTSAFIKKLQY